MLSIVICTYNRSDILPYCLNSLLVQSADQKMFEVLVLDNGSTDTTALVVASFLNKFHSLRYIIEPRVGLSHARNMGYIESRYDWVAYIDDDAKMHDQCIERMLWIIRNYDFDCFGGRFFPWYLHEKPKWLADDFGLFPKLKDHIAEIDSNQHVAGGIMVFKKQALIAVGGFPSELGMSGSQVGYGEENWVQDQMRKKSYRIGFDPELKIDHLVASYKYTLRWHLKRMYAKGKMERIMAIDKPGPAYKIYLLFRSLASGFFGLMKNWIKLITSKNYYKENYILESIGYVFKIMGYISSK